METKKTHQAPILGFIGLGAIGLPIAANLIAGGFKLRVHTRSRYAETHKKLKGAKSFSSPKEVSKGCDVLLLCVSDDKAVETVLFGENGADKSLEEGNIVIDLSTISPKKAKYFAKRLAKQNVVYLDAPVTGGTEGAEAGTLTIFLGGDEKSLRQVEHILNTIGNYIYPFGSIGKGQEVKALNQILVAGCYTAVAEALALGQRLELPMDIVVEALQKGAASSWALKNRSAAMLKNKYPLGFKLGLHYKDLCIALKTAEDAGLELPITNKVKEIEKELIKEGYKDYDVSVLRLSIG